MNAKRRIASALLVMMMVLGLNMNAIAMSNNNEVKTESAPEVTISKETKDIEVDHLVAGISGVYDIQLITVENNNLDTVGSGWKSDNEDATNNEQTDTETEVEEVEPVLPTFTETETSLSRYTTEILNVRSGADVQYEKLKTLSSGTQLNIVAVTDNNWYKVLFSDGSTGYVCGDYTCEEAPLISMGYYEISHYCGCAQCCGWTGGPTASGKMPVAGETIAMSSSVPFGTKVMIDGHIYTVEDRGGSLIESGQRIDVFMNSHQEALNAGLYTVEVFKVVE